MSTASRTPLLASPAAPASPMAQRTVKIAPVLVPRKVRLEPVAAKPIAKVCAPPAEIAMPDSDPISHFIDLEVEARRCADLDSLRFAIANSTRKIARFDQAFLVEPALGGTWIVSRGSSVATVDRNTPRVRSIEAFVQNLKREPGFTPVEPKVTRMMADTDAASPAGETAPAFALWLPIKANDGRLLAALVALKQESWRPQQLALLLPLAEAYGHAWAALAPKSDAPIARVRTFLTRKRIALGLGLIAMVGAFIPVPMSALAPADVVPSNPMLVTAPIDGVIGDILVGPGTWVEKDAPLLQFVDVKLRNEVEVARRNKAVTEVRHFKALQSAVAVQKDIQEIGTTKAEFDVAVAELAYAEEMLSRSLVRADRTGLLIYSAKSDWIGKPVSVGERIMEIGDPRHTEIRIDVPVSDAVALQTGGKISLFLDGNPLSSIEGRVHRMSYRPTQTGDHQMVYRVHGSFVDGEARRIGLRGVARVDSERVPLWFYLFRRPIAGIRQRFGV